MSDTDDAVPPDGPRSGLTPLELVQHLLARIEHGHKYARTRKKRFRRSSAAVQVASLALSGASTIILGLQDLDPWTAGRVHGSDAGSAGPGRRSTATPVRAPAGGG